MSQDYQPTHLVNFDEKGKMRLLALDPTTDHTDIVLDQKTRDENILEALLTKQPCIVNVQDLVRAFFAPARYRIAPLQKTFDTLTEKAKDVILAAAQKQGLRPHTAQQGRRNEAARPSSRKTTVPQATATL